MTMYRDSRFEMVNTPETWWELVPFIGAGLLALLFTAILVLLVEDADPKVVSTSETVSAPTVNAQQRPTFEGRLPRFVGLAEKGHMDDAEEIGLTLSRKGTFNILKWFSLGVQSLAATQPSSPSKPGPNVSTSSSRQPSRKAKNVPPPLSRLPIVRSATVFPRNLLVYPAPAVSEQELERPTTPTTPTSPPVTPLTPMSPPPTPMLSMAKLIMHRHDQANRKARRARQYAQQQQQQQLQQQHQPLTQIVVQ